MKRMRSTSVLLSVLAAGFVACDRSGGSDSSGADGSVSGRIVAEDGSPAGRANVLVFRCGDTSLAPLVRTTSRVDGSYLAGGLGSGCYTVIATDDSGRAVWRDSVLLHEGEQRSLIGDTLRPLGIAVGRVSLQPQHSPRMAKVVGEGFGWAANVDDSGRFRLSVPAGVVRLAILTSGHEYGTLRRADEFTPGIVRDLGVLEPEYLGVPQVRGLRVEWDSLAGIATVRWSRLGVAGVQGYAVKRAVRSLEAGGAVGIPLLPVAHPADLWFLARTSDTIFHDTLYRAGEIDLRGLALEYGVEGVVEGMFAERPWERVSVAVPSPWLIPAFGVRHEVLSRTPEQCVDIDTLAGGLVCVWSSRGMTGLRSWRRTFMDAERLKVWYSKDGRSWGEALPISGGALRVVPWGGRIWVVRGWDAVDSQIVPLLPGTIRWTSSDPTPTTDGDTVPRHLGAIVESWTVDGILERRDTLLSSLRNTASFRLAAEGAELLLSEDTAVATHTTPRLQSAAVRKLRDPRSPWSEVAADVYPSEWRADSIAALPLSDRSAAWSGVRWRDLELERSIRGENLVARPIGSGRIPWLLADSLLVGSVRYRGNGERVPSVLVWGDCLLLSRWAPILPETGWMEVSQVCPDSTR